MDLRRYLAVLVVVFIDGGESGGHGEKHHDHVKLHMPEFIHHDHHTKVITIHHHHHKPKKEHHHHHHHHHHAKPHIPHHHYNHNHHKTTLKTTTVSKGHKHHGHGHHGQHTGHHGHHSHHGGHGHHGNHDHSYHYDRPSISYDRNPISFEDEYKSYTPPVPAVIPRSPHVHGVVHTVKQVKVFDSLPGSLQGTVGGAGSSGYEVTEEGEEGNEDTFSSVNTIPHTFSGTYDFVRNAAPQHVDSFSGIALQSTVNSNHDPFASTHVASDFSGLENFSGGGQSDTFTNTLPMQGVLSNAHAPPEFASAPINPELTGFDDTENSFIGNDIGTALLSSEANDDTPVSYAREAGIQQTIKTGGIETLVY